jgi:hypothetical protein
VDFLRLWFYALVAGLPVPLSAVADVDTVKILSTATAPLVSGSRTINPNVVIEMENQANIDERHPISLNFESRAIAANRHAIEAIRHKLKETLIPKVDFHDVTVTEALALLNRETGVPIIDLFSEEPQPLPKGAVSPMEARITLRLENQSAEELLRYVTTLAGIVPRVEPGVIVCIPLTTAIQTLVREDFQVPGELLGNTSEKKLKAFFESKGVGFPRGNTLAYDRSKECLSVRNIEANLVLVELILDNLVLQSGEKQKTEEEVKFSRELRWIQSRKQERKKQKVRRVEIHDASMKEIVRELRPKIGPCIGIQVDSPTKICLSMKNTSVAELVQRIAERSGTRVVGGASIVFVPATAPLQ